ncbi:hypothetical protein LUW76_45090 [Actinomadura madurae]|nr:hypothetical protein [Actinomadura madurae]URN01863.1 hypothetical protein LUW76_45090 [Actinomadura madurae]
METTIVADNWSGALQIRSALDGRVVNAGVERYRNPPGVDLSREKPPPTADPGNAAPARHDGLVEDRGRGGGPHTGVRPGRTRSLTEPGWTGQDLTVNARENVPITVEKVAAVFTSRDRAVKEWGRP